MMERQSGEIRHLVCELQLALIRYSLDLSMFWAQTNSLKALTKKLASISHQSRFL